MSHSSADSSPSNTSPSTFVNLLVARIAFLTQCIHRRMGIWKVHPTAAGAVLVMSQCSLGDAAYLPQALRHGGLELHRMRTLPLPPKTDTADSEFGVLCVGEIRWPADPEHGGLLVGAAPQGPLEPEAAAPQSFSILVHATVPGSRLRAPRFLAKLASWVADVECQLACRWWHGIGSKEGANGSLSTLNLHLRARPDEPLTPYEFEQRVMPVLKQAARLTRQDGLLLRFDNPSTNFLVYCAAQHLVLPTGQPCPARHRHPG